ncbi:MAG: hypothetical protein LBK99_04375 [Opitutaceae bacterium]|nr:hypothetical protein [Opitutaceae bacterium]
MDGYVGFFVLYFWIHLAKNNRTEGGGGGVCVWGGGGGGGGDLNCVN